MPCNVWPAACCLDVDLAKGSLWNSWESLEYLSLLSIRLVMTLYGFTAGPVLNVICAALAFTLQVGSHVSPYSYFAD